MNLKVGDILEKDEYDNRVIVEVFNNLVAYDDCGIKWMRIKDLEAQGWQLKKTEEENNWNICSKCIKKKTRWVPGRKDVYWYMMDDGRITSKGWYCDYVDVGRYEIFNVFETKEQAEAYRSELIERGKV